jgi:uncharacterized protein YbbC (DUF1343 family)
VISGIDYLLARRLKLIKGRRVALLSHQAALVKGGATSAQALHRALGSSLKALFGPEHGFSGQSAAGEKTLSSIHPDWKIPVYALYGERRAPDPEMLADIDVVICDLQDIGVRCYTYLATMFNMYKCCRDAGVELIVTDRPIPLPAIVDGPMLQPTFESFVAPCALPMVYGMTPGETIRWISGRDSSLFQPQVITMQGWNRRDSLCFAADAGGFMSPSPGIKSVESACSYAALVFCEALIALDCGRGTNMAFRLFGAPWLESEKLCSRLNRKKIAGVEFHPFHYVGNAGRWQGRELNGVRLCVHSPALFHPATCSLHIIRELGDCYGYSRIWGGKGTRQRWFDKLYGEESTRRELKEGRSVKLIVKRWQRESQEFLAEREKVLLYK